MIRTLILGLFLISARAVFAQTDGNPERWCREGFFTRDSTEFKIASVKKSPSGRLYFHEDTGEECPGSAKCRRNAYLVPGDRVVVNRVSNNFACAWFSPAKGAPTVGWLDASTLSMEPPSVVAGTQSWLGTWKYAENTIEVTSNKLAGFVNVSGRAFWRGLGDNIHIGEIDGRYRPDHGLIKYSDGDSTYDCKAELRLAGPFLIVSDNMNCGGANVSFSGIYVRRNR